MIDELTNTAKQAGNEIINFGVLLNKKMDKWSDVPTRSDGLSPSECVGFINKETAITGLDLVIDIKAPVDKNAAILRIWAIEIISDESQNERFNNIQLDFKVDYEQAREVAKKEGNVTFDDFRQMLRGKNTKLSRVIVSDKSGRDKASQHILGQRHDLNLDEHDGREDIIGDVSNTLKNVLSTLKKSAEVEANS